MDLLQGIHLHELLPVDGGMGNAVEIPGELVARLHAGPVLPDARGKGHDLPLGKVDALSAAKELAKAAKEVLQKVKDLNDGYQ